MKKYTLIPTLISAVSLAVPAFADDLLPELSSDTITRLAGDRSGTAWDQNIGDPSSISATVVGNCYNTDFINGTGWYWGVGNLQDFGSGDFSFSETSFSYAGRTNYGGEFVAAVVELSDLLGDTGELLYSFTISFDMESDYSEGFHAYYVNTTTNEAVEFSSSADLVSGSYTYTWTADSEEDYLSSDYALIFIWNGKSGGGTVSVSDLSSSYVVTPEPSMFGLMFGLGAIGLVATRRRRRC